MSSKKKSKVGVERSLAEKLEIVQARQKGVGIEELKTLYHVGWESIKKWMEAYERNGIAGLEQTGNKRQPSELSAKVQAAEKIIEAVRQAEPNGGIGKAQGALQRHGFLSLARETVRKLLRSKGIGPVVIKANRRNKPKAVKHFERATPNEMWQTDIMSFMIKGQYRVYLIGFMDDNSRFLVGWGLYRFQTAANVQEVFRAAIEKHGMPKEVLSDNGRQYYTWRGKSAFTTMLIKLGIRHIRSRPYHPQTLGKIESFWRNLFQECLSQLPLSSFEEAKEKIGTYIEYYNFKRAHQGIGNMTPSDRFYRVANQVKQIVEQNTAQVETQAPPLADYTPPVYLVGNFGGKELRVVAKEAEVSLKERVDEPNKIAESAGAVGPDSVGDRPATADPGVVPTSGGVEGIVLPVDEANQANGAQGVGSQTTGTQASDGGSQPTDPEIKGANESTGETNAPATQGAGSSEIIVSSSAADHSTSSVGTDPSSGV
jgi:transposase InsO family protein